MNYALEIIPFGPKALIFNWPQQISEEINLDISEFNKQVLNKFSHLIVESVVTYCSLTLYLKTPHTPELLDRIKPILANKKMSMNPKVKSSTWHIPVCYDTSFGVDLDRIAVMHSMSTEEIINLHTLPLYHVYFLGFLPGFPYLGGMDKRLTTPRLESPRLHIAKGSVAIGNQQTGIYPSDSPGGWNIIGRTPVDIFNSENKQPVFLNAGDKIKFYAINLIEYKELFNRISKKEFNNEQLKTRHQIQ